MCLRGIRKLDMRKTPEMLGHKSCAEMEEKNERKMEWIPNKFGINDTNEEEGIFPHINSMPIGRAGNRDADLAQEVYDDRE